MPTIPRKASRDSAVNNAGLRFVTLTRFDHLPWNATFSSPGDHVAYRDPETFPHLEAALRQARARGLEHRIAMITPSGRT